MTNRNYRFEKRQRELLNKQRREQKRLRKSEKGVDAPAPATPEPPKQ